MNTWGTETCSLWKCVRWKGYCLRPRQPGELPAVSLANSLQGVGLTIPIQHLTEGCVCTAAICFLSFFYAKGLKAALHDLSQDVSEQNSVSGDSEGEVVVQKSAFWSLMCLLPV